MSHGAMRGNTSKLYVSHSGGRPYVKQPDTPTKMS
jgi:hypothetical protein